jgi:hypothetical protein
MGVPEKLGTHSLDRLRGPSKSIDPLQSRKLDPEAGREGRHTQVQTAACKIFRFPCPELI